MDNPGIKMQNYEDSLSSTQKDLLEAVKHQTLADVKISLGKCPNFKDDSRFSYVLLLVSLDRRDESIILLLIEENCTVSSSFKTNLYNTPLYYGLKEKGLTIFHELYKRGASIYDTDANRHSPLEYIMQHQVPYYWDFILSKIDFDSLDPNCQQHIALFHVACYRDDLKIVKELIERKFSVNSRLYILSKKWSGATPLQFALRGTGLKTKTVEYLLQFDIDFDLQDDVGTTLVLSTVEKPSILSFSSERNCVNDIDICKEYLRRSSKFHNRVNIYGLSHFHLLCSLNWDSKEVDNNETKLLKVLQNFIDSGVNINSANHFMNIGDRVDYAGFTALHWAVEKSSSKVVRLLLENGADPKIVDMNGRTPLHVLNFLNRSNFEMVHLLLEYGAEVDVRDFENQTPLHRAFNIQKRNEPLMKLLLSKSKVNVDLTNSSGLSYLHIASTRDFEKVKTLVENKASLNSRAELFYGFTPLHFAISFNNVEIVEYLLSQGSQVHLEMDIRFETTPLMHLAITEQLHLFYGAGDARDILFRSCILYLQNSPIQDLNDWILNRDKQMRIIELLVKYGASVNNEDSQGRTPMSAACCLPSTAGIFNIIKDFVVEHEKLFSRIFEEIKIRRTMIIQKLLGYGADVNSRGRHGKPIFHTLYNRSHECIFEKDIVEILLKGGANVDIADSKGLTLLHYIVINLTRDESFRVHPKDSLFIDLFLRFGANVNSKSINGDSILHSAVKWHLHGVKCREDLFVKLLEQPSIDLRVKNSIGDTPLHSAAKECQPFCVKSLLAAGADVNIENAQGHTPAIILQTIFEYRNNELRAENVGRVYVLIVTHLKKLIKLNRPLSTKNKNWLNALNEFNDSIGIPPIIDRGIENEMKTLRSTRIDQYTSLLRILVGDPKDMTNYVKNKDLMELMSSRQLEKDFPLFCSFLKDQWQKILSRSLVLDPAKKAFRVVTKLDWTESCCEEILRHLSNNDLNTLSQCICIDSVMEISARSSDKLDEPNAKIPRLR